MALKTWSGAAQAIAQVTKITFSVYSAAVVYTLTINGKSVTFTSVTGTNSEIWAGLVAAWIASAIPEHLEALATVDTGVVLTSATPGTPFTVTAGATSGTPTVSTTTTAIGPNHLMAPNNWVGGAAPSAADDLLFYDSAVDVLYDLQPATAFTSITIEASYTGRIGLPRVSASGYIEYRNRYLLLSADAVITIGANAGQGSGRILIDAGTNEVIGEVYNTGQGEGTGYPVEFINLDAATSVLSVYGGRVLLDGTGGVTGLVVIAREDTGRAPEVLASAAAGVVTASGQNTLLTIAASATSLDAYSGANVAVTEAATCPIVEVSSNARVFWDSSADITTKLFVYAAGYLSFARRKDARTVAAAEIHATGTLLDPSQTVTWTTGIDVIGLVGDVTLNVGRNVTLDVS